MGPKPRVNTTSRGGNYSSAAHASGGGGDTSNSHSSMHAHNTGHGSGSGSGNTGGHGAGSGTTARGKAKPRGSSHSHAAHAMEDAYGANGMSGMASDMANGSYGHSEFLSSANTAAVSGNSAVNGGVSSKYDPKGQATDQLDFSTLPAPTLRRYQRVHKLHYGKVRGGHREDLASAVTKHFNNQLVNELESIAWFIYAARSRDNELKLSQKPPT